MPKFVTSQHIEIDLNLASLGDRIIAFIIDAFVMFSFFIASMWIVAKMAGKSPLLFFIPLILIMFYSLVQEVFFEGQTIGKKAMNIKVVKEDGTPAGIGNYAIRWMLRLIDIYFMSGGVAVISIISTKNAQRLGDLAAGTIVIKLQKELSNADLISQFNDNHQVRFPTASMLNDRQIELIRNALDMRKDGLNSQAASVAAAKVKSLLSIDTDMPDVKFLHTIIVDYEFLANQG